MLNYRLNRVGSDIFRNDNRSVIRAQGLLFDVIWDLGVGRNGFDHFLLVFAFPVDLSDPRHETPVVLVFVLVVFFVFGLVVQLVKLRYFPFIILPKVHHLIEHVGQNLSVLLSPYFHFLPIRPGGHIVILNPLAIEDLCGSIF